jgi:hypothetical protein
MCCDDNPRIEGALEALRQSTSVSISHAHCCGAEAFCLSTSGVGKGLLHGVVSRESLLLRGWP